MEEETESCEMEKLKRIYWNEAKQKRTKRYTNNKGKGQRWVQKNNSCEKGYVTEWEQINDF